MYALLNDSDELVNGEPVQIFRKAKAETFNGVQHPRNWWQAYPVAQKESLHVFPIVRPPVNTDPQQEESGNFTYSFNGTEVIETPVLRTKLVPFTRSERIAELTAWATSLRDGGFIHGSDVFPSSEAAVGQIGLLYGGSQGGAPFSNSFGFRTRDNTKKVTLNTPQARKAFADDLIVHLDTINNAFDEHLVYLSDPARTVEELVDHDIKSTLVTAWPVVPEDTPVT